MTAPEAPAATAGAAPDRPPARCPRRPLAAYRDRSGRRREIVARPGAHGSVLVIDEDAETLADRRLVAHLPCDEPATNALVVCELYLADPSARFARPVGPEDWRRSPGALPGPPATGPPAVLSDAAGRSYRLAVRTARWGGGELRWSATDPGEAAPRTVSLRDVVGALEAYQPACAMTAAAAVSPPDALVSTLAIAGELERLGRSRRVLNRPLREAVQRALEEGDSLSRIAARCGRRKSRRAGPLVGDTSWLSRRIGLLPEAGHDEPSPWIDADVLAVIARDGLGLDPRQVEPA
jgi:hypothetical protein